MTHLAVATDLMEKDNSRADRGDPAKGGMIVDTLERVQKIIAEQMERPLSDIEPEAKLEDLGDSLDLIEVVYALEVEFKVDIPLNSKRPDEKLETVQDVARIIDRLVAEGDAA